MAEGTVFSGSQGSATIGSNQWNMKANAWTLTMENEVRETTGFSDGANRTYIPTGNINTTGTIGGEMTRDAADTAPTPGALADGASVPYSDVLAQTAITLVLTYTTATTACTMTGTGIITRSSHAVTRRDGTQTMVVDFQLSGPMTQVWDVT